MPRRTRFASSLAVSLALTASSTAAANPAEVFGFGSHHAGRVGAVAASVTDFASGYYNPAGLGFARGKQLAFGAVASVSNLRANDDRVPIEEPLGIVLGATTPAPLGGALENRVHVGVGLYLLPRRIIRVIARLPDEPFFPYYDNRTQRLVVLPTLALRVHDRVSIGVGLNYLATLQGQVQGREGATRAIDARVDEEVPSVLRLNAGLRLRAHDDFDLAIVFRQRFDIPFRTVADTNVAGQPIDLDIAANGLFTPTQVVVGGAWRVRPGAEVGLDATWANWSAYPGPYVTVRSELPLLEPFAGELPDVPLSDTFGARLGGELQVGVAWLLRAGYAFETSAFPAEQPGVTNLLDGPKHTLALGLGYTMPRGDAGWIRIDAHAQTQMVGARELDKTVLDDEAAADADPFDGLRDLDADAAGAQIDNPGYPSIDSSGQVFSAGVTVELGF